MIEPLYIKPTQSIPEVVLDKEKDLFLIKGNILPEDPFAFFEPIFDWFNEYAENPYEVTNIEIDALIINTSSTRRLVQFFMMLERLSNKKTKFIIHWISLSDDEIMQLAAYQFSKAFKKLTFITHIR